MHILPESAWREFRGAPKKPGQNPTTHQALIADQEGKEHKCYVKAAWHGSPMPLTEALAWILAGALDLPRPEFAALLILPMPLLREHVQLDDPQFQVPSTLAFCSSTIDGRHIHGPWRWLTHLRTARAFQHKDVSRIAAFDEWAQNQDRHLGNFLRRRGGGYVPIDNEYVLYGLLWDALLRSMGGGVAHQSVRQAARGVLNSGAYTRFEASMVLASMEHEAALLKAATSLRQFVCAFVADPATGAALADAVLQFLTNRAHRDWLANELGVIV